MIETAAPPSALRAQLAIEAAEERGDRATLTALAELYRQRADLANLYAEVLAANAWLQSVTASYTAALIRSTADDVAEELERSAVYVFSAEEGCSSMAALRAAAAEYTKLGRVAREAMLTTHVDGEFDG